MAGWEAAVAAQPATVPADATVAGGGDQQRDDFRLVTTLALARGAVVPAVGALILVVLTELVGWALHGTGWSFLDRVDSRLPSGSYATLTAAAVTAEATFRALFYTTVGWWGPTRT